MSVRLSSNEDTQKLKQYLEPHQAESMFICSNLEMSVAIEYKNAVFQGEYFGYFHDPQDQNSALLGVIVHYWNGNLMMHASNQQILKQLTQYFQKQLNRPIKAVLGPDNQASFVITNLELPSSHFSINNIENLYEIELENLNEIRLNSDMNIAPARDILRNILIKWLKDYNIEALGAIDNSSFERKIEEQLDVRLQKNDSWILLLNNIPVSLIGFNARITNMAQLGPVWTPPEYRGKGFASLFLSYQLYQEKLKKTKKAILFTKNPIAMKIYSKIGFKKIGDYRLAILKD